MAGERQLSDGNEAGQILGQSSTDKVGFYGTTPVVQGTATAVTAIGTTVFSEAKTGIWGFSTSTAAELVITRINQLVADIDKLKDTGILA